MQRKIQFFTFLLIGISNLLLVNCASKLVSGLEPTDEQINVESAKAYEEVKAKAKISTNKEWTEMLNRVAPRIAKASGYNFKWEWVLIDSPEVNAWCMPGGKMAVYTGIMPVLQNEAALAAVLGHEVAHATKSHGRQRYARAIKGNILGAVVGGAAIVGGQLLCKTATCKTLSGLSGAAAGFAITFFDRKFSRADESEADQEGQIFMAKAGYDPAEAIKLWERMAAASGGGKSSMEFMSTHPSEDRRQKDLSKWLGAANKYYQDAPKKYGLGEKIIK
jgi:predicted Zn-dependent protease